ncbi:MAG TPA: S8 family serine peptidase [Nakamurella sp.]
MTAGVTALALVLAPPAAAAPDDTQPIPEPAPTATGDPGESNALPVPETSGKYIVTLAKPPVAAYTGGEGDIPATKPVAGGTLEADSPAAQAYAQVITDDQASVAQSVGVTPAESFAVALNGFTAELSSSQAQELAAKPEVLSVAKDRWVTADDDRNSVDFLGLTGDDGLWTDEFGGAAGAGKGVVIGVIDTGIWPESASFAGQVLGDEPDPDDPNLAYRAGDQIVMQKADGGTFTGQCEAGEEFTADLCSTKIVSARFFADSYLAATPPANVDDLLSPRDVDGHGSHTGSTAAGNPDVPASVDGRDYGTIAGVAPAASIAVYKALWHRTTSATAGGLTSDLVAAFDQAVVDGVDVINYSVGSSSESSPDDPVELAMLSAASAGIFVAASAGNSGPGASTLDHPSPWVTTVAASTVAPREATVQLGNGGRFVGASTTVQSSLGPLPLIAAQSATLPPATAAQAALCTPGTLDPAVVAGRIVVCDRGVVDRVAKSAEVRRAGGVGMVLVNLTDNTVNADPHTVPTVHVNVPGGPAIKAYALTAGATATLVPDNTTGQATPYPQIAGFSSRGPSLTSNGDLIKPDIAAPGVDILAAFSPAAGGANRDFNFASGTSMAAPHIAGLAALIGQANPTWSPMAIKSALMTTAGNLKKADGTANTDPFAQGAGQVDARRMLIPALVYDSSDDDWLGYLEGLGLATGTGVAAVDPSNFNSPSIAVGDLVSARTITRKVTAITPGLYRATASVPGFRVTVSPSILNFDAAGQTKQFRVTLTRNTAAFGNFATGFLTWNGANTTVRSPIAVKPLQLSSSASTATLQPDGVGTATASWQVTSGFSGPFPITAGGVVAAKVASGEVSAGGTPRSLQQWTVAVPAGTPLARFATHVTDDTAGADIDMVVARQTSTGAVIVGQSDGPTATERVDLEAPTAGTYIVQVSAFADAPGTTSTPFELRSFVVPTGPVAGTPLTVSPANQTVRTGQIFTVTASATGLEPDLPYLGWVGYPDGSGTTIQVNPDN